MSLFKNILLFLGVGGGIGLFVLEKYKQLEKELQVIPRFTIPQFSLGGMTLQIDLTVKNPTSVKLDIMFPFMRLMLNNNVIGSSKVVNQVVTIPAYGEAQINNIQIPVTLLQEIDLAATLLLPLQSGQSVDAELVTVSALSYRLLNIPFERTNSITLKTA